MTVLLKKKLMYEKQKILTLRVSIILIKISYITLQKILK